MERRLSGMRVGVLAADGFEQVELTGPVKALRRHGAEVEVLSLRPGKIRGMNLMAPGRSVGVDRLVEEVTAADYDALLIPGGFVNPDLLRQSPRALQLVRAFDAASKPMAFLCHAPMVLISADLLRGRQLASWPGIKDDVRNAGGRWLDEPLVRDLNWVSSRGPQDLPRFEEGMIALFAEHRPAVPRAPRSPGRTLALRWAAAAATGAALVVAAGIGLAARRR